MAQYSLKELVWYFFKLGSLGFGGPVALAGYMHRDLVEKKAWISEAEYKEGLALSQLAPGPMATQLGIYLGYAHYGVIGATLTGIAFVLPSFVLVVCIGLTYRYFGGLPWMQAIFYGVGAAVIGIIAISCYKLTTKSISKIEINAFKDKWLLWLFFIVSMVYTFITQSEEVLIMLLAGVIYMFIKSSPNFLKNNANNVVLLDLFALTDWNSHQLVKLAIFFLKAGAFVFGSGLAIVPFLHGGLVHENHWLTEQEFLDAVAVAMISPGPVVITVAFIGFLIAGIPGATVAAFATFLPCYLFTVLPAPYFKKIASNTQIKYFVEGITAAVVGALTGAVGVIALKSIVDIYTLLIAVISMVLLLKIKWVNEPLIIVLAAFIGFIIKTWFV